MKGIATFGARVIMIILPALARVGFLTAGSAAVTAIAISQAGGKADATPAHQAV